MDFRDTPEEADFRSKVRAWLESHVARFGPPNRHGGYDDLETWRGWSDALYRAGYAGITWPREYGGSGLSASYEGIYLEESARANAAIHVGIIGLGMAGPTIMAHGTATQKAEHLPKILTAEEVFCQGFSEPDAGSDLAGVRTRSERQGNHYVVNGQKVWSSAAHLADYCILLTRSDPNAGERHRGLTFLLLDMHSPGVQVRPIRQITGDAEFNEIFLTDVEVPLDNLVGEEGQGWAVAMTTLLHERGTYGFTLTAHLEGMLRKLIDLIQGHPDREVQNNPLVRDQIAELWIELQGLRYTNYRTVTSLLKAGVPGPEGTIAKLQWSESNQRLTKLAREIEGTSSQLRGGEGGEDGFWQYQQLRSRGHTIEAGTSEILRNIIAERVLQLPRAR